MAMSKDKTLKKEIFDDEKNKIKILIKQEEY